MPLVACTSLPDQNGSSLIATRFEKQLANYVSAPAVRNTSSSHSLLLIGKQLLLAFRGEMLRGVMRKHRISVADLNGALRQKGVLNICQVEAVLIGASYLVPVSSASEQSLTHGCTEPTGAFSIYLRKDLEGNRDFVRASS